MKKIFLVVGCPGSGKSWVCEQLKGKYNYIRHDDYIESGPGSYLRAVLLAAKTSVKPLLIETPFSISQLKEPLEDEGRVVETFFIIEKPEVIAGRYLAREKKEIPKGHLSRQETYKKRSAEYGGFVGTSAEVLRKLSEANE